MKAKPYKRLEDGSLIECLPEEATDLFFRLPGTISQLMIPVIRSGSREGTKRWSWNGSLDKPTLKPSILNDFRPHSPLVNHLWINDGKVIYLDDCTHELAGKTLDLLPVDS